MRQRIDNGPTLSTDKKGTPQPGGSGVREQRKMLSAVAYIRVADQKVPFSLCAYVLRYALGTESDGPRAGRVLCWGR